MGSFFTSVQVHAGDVGVARALAIVMDAIRQRVCDAGYRVAREGESADRTIAVAAHRDGPWIAVYDQDTEEQDLTQLEGWADDLARATASSAVAVLVHDSDVLDLALWRGGERVDTYCSHPGYFSASLTSAQRARAGGRPERWEGLLRPGASIASLGEAWGAERLFAEETLAATASLLGWDATRCGVGFRALDAGSDVEWMGFRLLARPSHEALRTGPPRLVSTAALHGIQAPPTRLAVGDGLRFVATCTSVGGPAIGLRVTVRGPAVDAGLVEPDHVHVTVGSPRDNGPLRAVLHREGKQWIAAFPELAIPAGLAHPPEQASYDPSAFMRAWKASQEKQIHVLLQGPIRASGQGALHVGMSVDGAEGDATNTTVLTVAPPLRRPLRCSASAESHLLQPLLLPTRLVAVVTLGEDRDAAAAFAARAMERWSHWVAPAGDSFATVIMPSDPRARPKTGKLSAKTIPKGKRWKDLRASFASLRGFTASIRADVAMPFEGEEAPSAMLSRAGFALGVPLFPQNEGADPSHVHLGLWMNLPGRTQEQSSRGKALLRAIVDEAMAEHGALQGFLARWAWTPEWMDTTPYEIACGVHGQCTMKRSWCTRYLRGVSEDAVWLGEELLDALGDTTALEDVAELTEVGSGVRVEMGEGSSLDALERALALLLPASQDWEQATKAMYDGEREGAKG